MSSDPKAVVREFATICAATQMTHTLYWHLFEQDQHRLRLYDEIAPLTFHDLSDIVGHELHCKMLPWSDEVRKRLAAVNARLMAFRAHIEEGRSKRIAHTDLTAQMQRLDRMGGFPNGSDWLFLRDLQEFVDIAAGEHIPLNVAMSDDVYLLIRALEKAKLYDSCSLCDATTRDKAVLDYEDCVNEENWKRRT